ncbi:hypothetical protein BD626DRAFT_278826 [Schizophyllum amplum]|uniref:Uncharacterized protein n=1 Tax=Schizophyllum amplum TaxID=97359 RepID=A0A550BTD3_9AGAR|nr:hypothetical protein BD626DRAFT_278826 [Auriculariopsis ampla]
MAYMGSMGSKAHSLYRSYPTPAIWSLASPAASTTPALRPTHKSSSQLRQPPATPEATISHSAQHESTRLPAPHAPSATRTGRSGARLATLHLNHYPIRIFKSIWSTAVIFDHLRLRVLPPRPTALGALSPAAATPREEIYLSSSKRRRRSEVLMRCRRR